MKKLYTISILMLVMLLVMGCSTGGYPLTPEESDAIAEYSAHLIMKYDKNHLYKDKLLDKKDYEEAIVTPEPTATPTPKPTATPKPTKEPEQNDNTNVDNDTTDNQENEPTVTPAESDKAEENESGSSVSMDSLSEVFGDSFEVSYVKKYIAESFSENAYITLSAPDGKYLCIVTLNIKNISDKTQRVKADKLNVSYWLYDGKKAVDSAELSLLSNDIQFLDDDIKAGGSMETVILFYTTNQDGDYRLRFKANEFGRIYEMKLE